MDENDAMSMYHSRAWNNDAAARAEPLRAAADGGDMTGACGGGVKGACAMMLRVLESKMLSALLLAAPPSSSTHALIAAHIPPPPPVIVAAATRFIRARLGSCTLRLIKGRKREADPL